MSLKYMENAVDIPNLAKVAKSFKHCYPLTFIYDPNNKTWYVNESLDDSSDWKICTSGKVRQYICLGYIPLLEDLQYYEFNDKALLVDTLLSKLRDKSFRKKLVIELQHHYISNTS